MNEDIAKQLTSTFLRGFRDAVAGVGGPIVEDALRRARGGSYERGYRDGQEALKMAQARATIHAASVIDSPAMTQAALNAGVGF